MRVLRDLSKSWMLFVYTVLIFCAVAVPLSPQKAGAAPCSDFQKSVLGIPTWYKYLEGDNSSGTCRPILRTEDVEQGGVSEENINNALPIALAILEIAITIAGIVAFVMILWGSFKFLFSLGEPDKASSARKTVINALIGLVITILATRVITFVGSRLG